ncbi:MAG: Asp-tRNA(Asn)/Glu-tRNA(Gln) amidotransferase subunit GatC [Acidobacteria bacterium]|nr:Asp-tRNA(Asn)/Glu-tRNA(Gln) amidotransferase subunit GatC [Acidobacteriota bacterium]
MKITRKDVEYVAALAHLELTAEETERMRQQLDSILGYIEKLNELDTAGVEPMAQVLAPTVSGQADTRANPSLRKDATRAGLERTEALAVAPETDGAFFKVPKVIEK